MFCSLTHSNCPTCPCSFAILMAQVLGNCEPYVGMSYNDIFLAVVGEVAKEVKVKGNGESAW